MLGKTRKHFVFIIHTFFLGDHFGHANNFDEMTTTQALIIHDLTTLSGQKSFQSTQYYYFHAPTRNQSFPSADILRHEGDRTQ